MTKAFNYAVKKYGNKECLGTRQVRKLFFKKKLRNQQLTTLFIDAQLPMPIAQVLGVRFFIALFHFFPLFWRRVKMTVWVFFIN